ncbi:MAG: ABC transporter permease subunit [Pirellulaceae bacterium]
MSDSSQNTNGRPKGGRLFRLTQKELRETLRDRRTIITLIAMPLIVYPILSLIFKTFLLSNLGLTAGDNEIKYRFLILADLNRPDTSQDALNGVLAEINDKWELRKVGQANAPKGSDNPTPESESAQDRPPSEEKKKSGGPRVAKFIDHYWEFAPLGSLNADELFKEKLHDAIVEIVVLEDGKNRKYVANVYSSDQDAPSIAATRFFKERLANFNTFVLQRRLVTAKIDPRLFLEPVDKKVELEESGNQFTAMIPLILVLMTITGAVYPAIDLTAGERERGTLETLIAAPVPRIRVLVAKMIAVITVAVLTASLNVLGMVVTLWAFQLETVILGEDGLTIVMAAKVLMLLALFATFFAALLLVVTSFARSFKEAQAYLIPIILMSMAPGLLAMTPGLKLDGPLAVCPMVNLLLLSRDVLENNVQVIPAAVAIFSTCVYGALALAAAASIFGADSILYGSQSSWKELFAQPVRTSAVAPLNVAMVCLMVLLPINFVAIAFMGRLASPEVGGISVTYQLMLMSFFTFLAFWAFPTLIALQRRITLSTGFGFLPARPHLIFLGIVMGLSMWPLVMALINGWYELISLLYSSDAASEWHSRLTQFSEAQAAKFRETSPGVIAFAMAIIPALCEEWFFRGMLQRSLLTSMKPWKAIAISALAFGVFHTLSGSVVSFDRLLPTALMGLLLGLLAYKANSIVPGILMHSVHNATIAFIAYYLPQLNAIPGFPKDAETIPISWTIASAVIAVVALTILLRTKNPPKLVEKT